MTMEYNESLRRSIDLLNPEQTEAVMNTQGPMLIIAGAGSGKTRVLTTRIALLIAKGVPPERILALTFTKKAAGEMASRAADLAGPDARRVTMGTFHSVFIRFLRPNASRLGFPDSFTVLDEDDSLSCLKRCTEAVLNTSRPPKDTWTDSMRKRFADEDRPYSAHALRPLISRCKNDLVTPETYGLDPQRRREDRADRRPRAGEIFTEYRNACHRMAVMDFDDILLYTDMLLANCPDVLADIAGSYDYILVDEYQDTNLAQYSILRRLTAHNSNICVVGDDSQSIYAFRGARIQNILNFRRDYPGCRVVKLEQNYRSTKNIVAAANNLIAHNGDRIPKVCRTDNGKGDPLSVTVLADDREEAQFIADTAAELHASGTRYDDIAVLYRTNSQSRAIEDALMRSKVPYTVFSGTSFFSRAEVKDLMAYFRLAVNPKDDEAFLRVMNRPARGVGKTAEGLLANYARMRGLSLWDAATDPLLPSSGIKARALAGIGSFVSDLITCMGAAASMDAFAAASSICDLTGFYNEAKADPDPKGRDRADNIRELVDSAKAFTEDMKNVNEGLPEEQRTPATLAAYIQNVMLLSNADTGDGSEGKVSLMTVHCAKGMEFDTVFVAGAEDTLFPLDSCGRMSDIEEERRLFYVAMTRARKLLHITMAESRLRFGRKQSMKASPFIRELTGMTNNKTKRHG